ncbi:MAG: hypothetical protein AB8B61_04635 [Cyclobacteriaceae bacterium]
MKQLTTVFTLTLLTFSCTRLTSTDIPLATNCGDFSDKLISQIQNKQLPYIHYIGVEKEKCTLVLKYEKEKGNIDEIKQLVIASAYHFIETVEESKEDMLEL